MFFVDPFQRDEAKRANVSGLRDCLRHLKGGGLLGVFPGNRVSHWQWSRWEVADNDWVPNIAQLIRRAGASVVPIFIEGGNSLLFNIAGMINPLLRTALLPRELVNRARDPEPVRLTIGNAIPFPRLKKFEKDEDLMGFLRVATYVLGNRPQSVPAPLLAEAKQTQAAEPIAEKLAPELLEQDITALPAACLMLAQGEFEAYIATFDQLPHIMQEIGRGREVSFRLAGGGTKKAIDLAPQDEHYHHLFLWHKKDRAVVGSYRLGLTDLIIPKHGTKGIVCTGLFDLKPEFLKELDPGIETGRSYVLPEYQRNYNSLLMLWGGVLAFVGKNPKYRVVFGSVGISQGDEYAPASRTLIVNFMQQQHSHPLGEHVESLSPFQGVKITGVKRKEIKNLVQRVEDVSALITGIEQDGKGVPILIKHYLRLNAKLLDFGVWKNHSNAVVSFIMVDLTTSDPKFLRRYMGAEGYENFMKHHGVAPPTEPLTAEG
jgi:putative hemolysin